MKTRLHVELTAKQHKFVNKLRHGSKRQLVSAFIDVVMTYEQKHGLADIYRLINSDNFLLELSKGLPNGNDK